MYGGVFCMLFLVLLLWLEPRVAKLKKNHEKKCNDRQNYIKLALPVPNR